MQGYEHHLDIVVPLDLVKNILLRPGILTHRQTMEAPVIFD
jgi:hypothetical protein